MGKRCQRKLGNPVVTNLCCGFPDDTLFCLDGKDGFIRLLENIFTESFP